MDERNGRFIHSKSNHRQISELLQLIFVAELTHPSKCIWIVSPWISDIPILDNKVNQFIILDTGWSKSLIRLSAVLIKLAENGTTVRVATRPDPHNRPFLESLEEAVKQDNLPIRIHQQAELHEKGILGNDYYISGSMNFTYNGITINQEALQYHTNPAIVSENRMVLSSRWGCEL